LPDPETRHDRAPERDADVDPFQVVLAGTDDGMLDRG
jgi:hypothetical protein